MAEAAEKNRQSICISQNSLVWQDDSVFKLYYYCMNCACRQKAEICGKQLTPGQLLFSYRKTALEAAKSSIAWTKDGGQYIPGISKWLQREPWREANLQKAQKENQEQWNSQ